jgi:hypothetical protein
VSAPLWFSTFLCVMRHVLLVEVSMLVGMLLGQWSVFRAAERIVWKKPTTPSGNNAARQEEERDE